MFGLTTLAIWSINWVSFICLSPASAVQAPEAAVEAARGADRLVLVEQVSARPVPVLALRHHRADRGPGTRTTTE